MVNDVPESSVRVRSYKDIDLGGATIVEAIPSQGLTAAIAGGYLVRELGLDHAVGFDSDVFPPVSMVWKGKPRSPLRLYARPAQGGKPPFGVLLCEFTPAPRLFRPIARGLLDWAEGAGVTRIVSPDGVFTSRPDYSHENPRVFAAGSTQSAREAVQKAGVTLLEAGMVAGVSGMLLTEGLDRFDVINLLVELDPQPEGRIHDARAAVSLMEPLRRLLPDAGVSVKPLLEEATRAEAALRQLRQTAQDQAMQDDVQAAYR